MNITDDEVISYLRQLDRELSRRAEQMTNDGHPMAAHFESDASKASAEIESVVTRLQTREAEQRAECEAREPSRRWPDRECFNTP